MIYTWDETKRMSNLRKHGLDFKDAALVYENELKITIDRERCGEDRKQDIALVLISKRVFSLVYVIRDHTVRCISFRPASEEEREVYAEERRKPDAE